MINMKCEHCSKELPFNRKREYSLHQTIATTLCDECLVEFNLWMDVQKAHINADLLEKIFKWLRFRNIEGD